jgi:hypothetical protein
VIATIERGRDQKTDSPEGTGGQPYPRVDDYPGGSVAVDTARGIIATARSARAERSWFSLDRAYFVGVEVAAEQVLHPDTDWVRQVTWLDRYNPAFVAGFVETTARLASMWSWPSET